MLNMIKADFYRIVRSKAIYLAVALMLMMLAVDIYTVEAGNLGVQLSVDTGDNAERNREPMQTDDGAQISSLSMKDYRNVKLKMPGYALDQDVLACNLNLYYLFIFVAAVAVSADFSGSCVKNTLSFAIDRRKYFLSKFLFVMLCCVALLFVNTYVMYFGNLLCNGSHFASDLGNVTRITLLQLPPMLALAGILTGFAFLFRRMAVFNAVAIPFIMVAQVLFHFLSFVLKLPEETMYYELQVMIARLSMEPSRPYLLRSYVVCGGLILLFGAAGWLSFRKTEIR